MISIHNEKELLLLVASGDEEAFQKIFDWYWSQVYSFGMKVTKSPEQSRDLAQDVFLRIWQLRSKLGEVRDFKSYLFIILRNLTHDRIRTQLFRESNKAFMIDYFPRVEFSQADALEHKELQQQLQTAIDQLPPKLHRVFTLLHFEGLSHLEISRLLQISPLSSKKYMVRAMVILRRKFLKDPETLTVLIVLSLRGLLL